MKMSSEPKDNNFLRSTVYDEFDALLADLQNTVSPSGGGLSTSSSGYGSLNTPRGGHRGPSPPVKEGLSMSRTADISYSAKTNVPHGWTGSLSDARSPSYGNYHPSTPDGVTGGGKRTFNNNLSELDNLLQDLSNSTYENQQQQHHQYGGTNGSLNGSYGGGSGRKSPATYSKPSSAQSASLNRPSVDSLLDELNSGGEGEVIYSGPRKVTITVKETKTETGFPGETELLSSSSSTSHLANIGAPPPIAAASSATRELDELMSTLSEVKVSKQVVGNTSSGVPQEFFSSAEEHHQVQQYARPVKSARSYQPASRQQLDCMLDNLQEDMSRQGVNTSQKGCCNACEKPIVGQVITALGKTWHPEHFVCSHCTQELGTRNFFERDGKPYCEPDYHNLFSPRCAYCNGPILDKCVTALEKTWHMEHFFCAQCGKQFGEEGFHERDGKPYCRDDYFDMFAPKCGACNRAIMENYISALNSQWHPNCFVCRDCKLPVQGKSFYAVEGKPVCPACIGAEEEEEQ